MAHMTTIRRANTPRRAPGTTPLTADKRVETTGENGINDTNGERRKIGNRLASVIGKILKQDIENAALTIPKFYHRAPGGSGIYGKMPCFTHPANVRTWWRNFS